MFNGCFAVCQPFVSVVSTVFMCSCAGAVSGTCFAYDFSPCVSQAWLSIFRINFYCLIMVDMLVGLICCRMVGCGIDKQEGNSALLYLALFISVYHRWQGSLG